MRLALLSNVTVDLLAGMVKKTNDRRNIKQSGCDIVNDAYFSVALHVPPPGIRLVKMIFDTLCPAAIRQSQSAATDD